MLGIESNSTASSDDSRASSGAELPPPSSMITIGGGYADGSGELRAALGRMSLEPAAGRGQQDMVMVKQEEIDDVDEEEDFEDVKEEQDEDMLPSHVRAESVVEHLIAPYHADERMVSRGLPQVSESRLKVAFFVDTDGIFFCSTSRSTLSPHLPRWRLTIVRKLSSQCPLNPKRS